MTTLLWTIAAGRSLDPTATHAAPVPLPQTSPTAAPLLC